VGVRRRHGPRQGKVTRETESAHPHAPPHDIAPNLRVFPHRWGQLKAAIQAQIHAGALSGLKLKKWVNQLQQHNDHAVIRDAGKNEEGKGQQKVRCGRKPGMLLPVCPRLPCHSPSLLTAHTTQHAVLLNTGVSYGPLCSPWGLTLARPPLVCAGRVLGCAGGI
jgi:hypothetical protein